MNNEKMNNEKMNNEKMNNENKDLEEFKKNIELQEKIVNEKINPILQSYKDGQIDRKEFIERLIEAFYSLEDGNI